MPPARAIALGLEVFCDALVTAHRAGVLHRDLKPGNMMLTPSGVKLLDFALAKSTAGGAPGDAAATVTTPLTARGTSIAISRAPSRTPGFPDCSSPPTAG